MPNGRNTERATTATWRRLPTRTERRRITGTSRYTYDDNGDLMSNFYNLIDRGLANDFSFITEKKDGLAVIDGVTDSGVPATALGGHITLYQSFYKQTAEGQTQSILHELIHAAASAGGSDYESTSTLENDKPDIRSWKEYPDDRRFYYSGPEVMQIESDPNNPEWIYILTYKGLYISRDMGKTFELANLARGWIRSIDRIAVDPLDGRYLYATVNLGKIFRSSDYGNTWELIRLPPVPLYPIYEYNINKEQY